VIGASAWSDTGELDFVMWSQRKGLLSTQGRRLGGNRISV